MNIKKVCTLLISFTLLNQVYVRGSKEKTIGEAGITTCTFLYGPFLDMEKGSQLKTCLEKGHADFLVQSLTKEAIYTELFIHRMVVFADPENTFCKRSTMLATAIKVINSITQKVGKGFLLEVLAKKLQEINTKSAVYKASILKQKTKDVNKYKSIIQKLEKINKKYEQKNLIECLLQCSVSPISLSFINNKLIPPIQYQNFLGKQYYWDGSNTLTYLYQTDLSQYRSLANQVFVQVTSYWRPIYLPRKENEEMVSPNKHYDANQIVAAAATLGYYLSDIEKSAEKQQGFPWFPTSINYYYCPLNILLEGTIPHLESTTFALETLGSLACNSNKYVTASSYYEECIKSFASEDKGEHYIGLLDKLRNIYMRRNMKVKAKKIEEEINSLKSKK